MKYHALFVIFEKVKKKLNCLLLQISGGALRVNSSVNYNLQQETLYPAGSFRKLIKLNISCEDNQNEAVMKVRKRAKIRNRYNQAPHLTQNTNGKVTTSQLDITNESQEVSPFPAGDHKASINRSAR